jgi:acetyl esterase/lipase
MKTPILRALCLLLFATTIAAAQGVIPLYQGTPPGSTPETYPEKSYFSKLWNTEVVTNVTKPTLTVIKPSPETKNGTAIVIAPGGGFMALSITSEGTDVAKYLAAKGVTAFVLKYRVAHTGEDATQEFTTLIADRQKFGEVVGKIIPLSIADGQAAVTYVRQHASEWGISADRVGIIGFSAGGTVTAGVAFHYTPDGRPAFVAPIYAAAGRLKDSTVPADAPPMFIAAATDDSLGLAPDSIALYEKWREAQKSVELHMYAKGGHGFGMHQHNIPTDHWIDRFAEWLDLQGFLKRPTAASDKSASDSFHLGPWEQSIGYSQAIRKGNTLYVSGTVGANGKGEPQDLDGQMKRAYSNIQKTLAHYNTDFSHIVAERIYTTDIDALIRSQETRKQFYGDSLPAATWVEVKRLYSPGDKLEIEVEVSLD